MEGQLGGAPEFSPRGAAADDNLKEAAAFQGRGCCFWLPCFRRRPSGVWERIQTSGGHKEEINTWLSKGVQVFMRVREWSELVAGPRWKTFIRRFNKRRSKPGMFRYDPVSYALNFDEGSAHGVDAADDDVLRDVSPRYAPITATMDSGRGASPFT
ncbi:unnamed protein product [Cuscuta campestris]|uniref:Uncharacterized protein n=2 Tax=Cuscuta sect. Cleistogrammica TaxID=1824901 RepID=A0A484N7Q2_9ASTE|nr:hypothetical protein DM860_005155 [Cuscuta australis]VFQ96899.1 unnamed protein product [Cuscuta campestris]